MNRRRIFALSLCLPSLAMWLLFFPGMVTHAQSVDPTEELQPPYVECCKNNSTFANLRSGPNAVFYPLIGSLTTGQRVPALGKSKGSGWIQIKYVAVPSGVAWVSMDYVVLRLGAADLPILEAPPVPTIPYANTVDPTLAFAFAANYSTRLPTYTSAPLYTTPSPPPVDEKSSGGFPMAVLILILLTLGGFSGLFSAALGRH
jgi:uncharacterized protein YraI